MPDLSEQRNFIVESENTFDVVLKHRLLDGLESEFPFLL